MRKIDRLLKSLNAIIKEEEEDITKLVPDFPGLKEVPGYIEDYEKKVAKLLRNQRKHFVNGINSYIGKDSDYESLFEHLKQKLFQEDEFVEEMTDETKSFLMTSIPALTKEIMEAIDKDVPFETLSKRTVKWIGDWSQELAEIMKLNTHEGIEKVLKETLENGDGIEKAVLKLKDMPEFDRTRARTVAITEILTASSRSQWEAYQQSPAVSGKTWLHSGSKKNNPRKAHVKLSGTTVPVDEKFDVNGHEADYPRDPALPASERVRCHCAMSPSVDKKVLGLSEEEKKEIRQEVLAELNK